MNDPAEPDAAEDGEQPAADPRDLFRDAALLKQERRRRLHQALAGPAPETGSDSVRDRLEQLLGPDTLATVDQHLLALLTEGEPAGTDVVTAAAASKTAGKQALVDALKGRRPQPPPDTNAAGGFDGGTRTSPPPPPVSHGDWLVQAIRSRAADRGVSF